MLSIRRAVDKPKRFSGQKPRCARNLTPRGDSQDFKKNHFLLAELQLHTKRNLLRKQATNFDSVSSFLKELEDRLTSLKRVTLKHVGGRGRRS